MKKYISLLFLILALASVFILSSCSEKIGGGYIYTIDDGGITLRQYLGFKKDVVIPDEIDGYPVRYIGQQAFQRKRITSVTVPEGVTEIQISAFEHCTRLKTVNLPNSLRYIGHYAFQYCKSLESIHIPENVTEFGTMAFCGCTSLKEINFPDSLTIIGGLAFEDCDSLENIPLHNGIKNIETLIFKNCDKITVTIWENGGYYGSVDNPYFALYGMVDGDCESFEIHPDTKIICGEALGKGSKIKEIIVPEGVVSVCEKAFYYCDAVEKIALPSTLEFISDYCVFPDDIAPLKKITIPENSEHFKIVNGALLSADGTNLIKYPQKMEGTEYIVPDGVEYIYEKAFESAIYLTSVTFPDSLIEIGRYAFCDCISLKEIDFGNGLKIIGAGCFWDCDSLEKAVIPDSVEELDGFSQCDNLREVIIGKGVVAIERDTFYGCDNLESIVFLDPYGWYGSAMYIGLVDNIDFSDPKKNAEMINNELAQYWLLKRTE